jgi:hypothetical protein
MNPSCSLAASLIRDGSLGGSKTSSTSASTTLGTASTWRRTSSTRTGPMPQAGEEGPAFERFIFVTAGRPFEVAGVVDAARTLAARADARVARLPLAPDLSEASLVVSKELP